LALAPWQKSLEKERISQQRRVGAQQSNQLGKWKPQERVVQQGQLGGRPNGRPKAHRPKAHELDAGGVAGMAAQKLLNFYFLNYFFLFISHHSGTGEEEENDYDSTWLMKKQFMVMVGEHFSLVNLCTIQLFHILLSFPKWPKRMANKLRLCAMNGWIGNWVDRLCKRLCAMIDCAAETMLGGLAG
jgi:hypothetical protein